MDDIEIDEARDLGGRGKVNPVGPPRTRFASLQAHILVRGEVPKKRDLTEGPSSENDLVKNPEERGHSQISLSPSLHGPKKRAPHLVIILIAIVSPEISSCALTTSPYAPCPNSLTSFHLFSTWNGLPRHMNEW